MHFSQSIIAALPLFALSALAAPRPGTDCTPVAPPPPPPPCTTTVPATTTTSAASTTSVAPITSPTAPYSVMALRSASPIHFLQMNAAGQAFWLGGETASYCPDQVLQMGDCPPGNVTAFLGLGALDTEVPGGQLVYVAPEGYLGFTQAHSAYYPPGSVIAPFTYSFTPGASFGFLGTDAFGATGFMACPNTSNITEASSWQVFAALQNATVPTGNVSDCLGFDAATIDYISPNGEAAAWQYT